MLRLFSKKKYINIMFLWMFIKKAIVHQKNKIIECVSAWLQIHRYMIIIYHSEYNILINIMLYHSAQYILCTK